MNLPVYIPIFFVTCLIYTSIVFFKATKPSKSFFVGYLIWLILQGGLAYSGFYLNVKAIPPRLIFVLFPAILFIVLCLTTQKGKTWLLQWNTRKLTLVHWVRIPIEIILYLLFTNKAIPELMTFAGRNFDILAGITAILIYFYQAKSTNKKVLIAWNIAGIILLFNIVINAILSTPFPFQQFAFDQPNWAVLYFPYVWLPAAIVPLVMFSHFASIWRLRQELK